MNYDADSIVMVS